MLSLSKSCTAPVAAAPAAALAAAAVCCAIVRDLLQKVFIGISRELKRRAPYSMKIELFGRHSPIGIGIISLCCL